MHILTTSRIIYAELSPSTFYSVWKTDNTSDGSSNSNQISLPLEETGTYNFTVDWGDETSNTITSYNQMEVTHTYANSGTYNIKIDGQCEGFCFYNLGDKLKLLEIKQWGTDFQVGNTGFYFYGCSNMDLTATDTLKNTSMNTMYRMFMDCEKLNGELKIDTSNVLSFDSMYANCILFNKPCSFNTASAFNMAYMYSGCESFNQSLNFNTSLVEYFSGMFAWCSAFNQDISGFDLTSALYMDDFMTGSFYWSKANYDLFLISASGQSVNNSISFGCSSVYTLGGSAESARTNLVTNKLWSITDLGGE